MHQTIVVGSIEADGKSRRLSGIIIAPFGGGSNLQALHSLFGEQAYRGKNVETIAVRATACPKLTRGVFRYDFGDTVGMTQVIPMYAQGHNFIPSPIHAGGLRYHGAGAIVSQLLKGWPH